jgi:multidrug resistance efflux pump
MKKVLHLLIKILVSGVLFGSAGYFGYGKYKEYFSNPWTRDAQVLAQVIQVTPRVSGTITHIAVKENAFVHQGELLFEIDDAPFKIKIEQIKAQLRREKITLKGAKIEYERVKKISQKDKGAISQKDLIRHEVNYHKSLANIDTLQEKLNNAKLNLTFTKVYASVDGYISNINFQIGSQAVANKPLVALVDSHSFWVGAYFRESMLAHIKPHDEAVVTLMAYEDTPLEGYVESIGWGIAPSDGNPGVNLLPSIKPVFPWIRLAQRVAVHVKLKEPLPPFVKLRVGLSASVQVLHKKQTK